MQASVFRDDLFANRVAFVTGGSKGIGLAIATELRLLGAHVVIGSRKEEHLLAGRAQLEAQAGRGRVSHHVCNIRERASIDAAVDHALAEFGRIDLLINNAGGQFPMPAAGMSAKGWQAVIDTNLTGTFFMSQAVVLKSMSLRKGGAIVNIIAQMWNGFPLMSHTGAARAGVENLTKTLAFEWSAFGVRVNAVAPGVILSSGVDNYAPEFQQAFLDSVNYIPAGRLGTPREVAAATAFLLSPAAAFITGSTLRVDGGEPSYGSAAACMLGQQLTPEPTDAYE